ncbi:uncharacterized protein EKO05_0010475 [Ascochyta rabiei]|uniref:Uncharacterized protein n=1 Tax=Didymella rabiei TaxID=5454 RepID=A0A163KZD6_DIDRA|nr:uncharacterized protein EKO05_0010475 [Ascochyta rabiei]KZM27371.1 hypothetical protein ST47_g1480 [Ascochyta rabiei]UPX20235.1 hypothetical protein EKO05_0010475 [Ascochyta rabiei]
MANLDPSEAVTIATALGRLDKLKTDEYITAFGPDGRQFFATPNGYSATQLPVEVLADLTTKRIKRVAWASYGSHTNSWFFAYEMVDGTCTFRVGAAVPPALDPFIEEIKPTPPLLTTLRVQLGDNNSFIAWSKTSWACHGIPAALEAELCQMSWTHMRSDTITRGLLQSEVKQATWHGDGSYYVESQEGRGWKFESDSTQQAWSRLWRGRPSRKELSELVLVAVDPHAPVGETFAFIKKQHDAQEAPFVVHFYGEPIYVTATPPTQDTRLQRVDITPDEPAHFRWATSKRDGRPHRGESRELELNKGQRIKVWDDKGRNWFIAEGRRGVKGWVHGSWLDLCGSKVHSDPQTTYLEFQEEMRRLLVPGQLHAFPRLHQYTNACSNAACAPLKSSTQLGICVHDLQTLLQGSGRYSCAWLKEERNVWHPDKFARFCVAGRKEQLKACAQEVFVLYGVLMDMCEPGE